MTMEGVRMRGAVAAAMPAVEVASTLAGARKHASRRARVAPLQSAFLSTTVPLPCPSKTCIFPTLRCAGRAVSVSAASGDSYSNSRRTSEPVPEVYFYSPGALGQTPPGGKRIKWEIGSVAGEVKEMAPSSPDAPFASWSNLGFNGGKRKDLKKILVLGAGLLTDHNSFLVFHSSVYSRARIPRHYTFDAKTWLCLLLFHEMLIL